MDISPNTLLDIDTMMAGVAAFLSVFTFRLIFQRIGDRELAHAKLETEFRTFVVLLPDKYVSKDDYREDIRELKGDLKRILELLDRKVDK